MKPRSIRLARTIEAALALAALAPSARAQVRIAVEAPASQGSLATAPAALAPSAVPVLSLSAPAASLALAPSAPSLAAASLPAVAPAPALTAAAAPAEIPAAAANDGGASRSIFGFVSGLMKRGSGGEPAANRANVEAEPAAFAALTGKTAERVRRLAETARLRLIDVEPGRDSEARELPVELVPGRYYVAVRTPDGVALADYALRHGGHRNLTRALGLPAPRKLDTDGTAVGGAIFYDDGVVVSGQALRYPDARNAADLARALKRMGFRVLEKRAGPIHGPNSSTPRSFDARNMPLGI